MDTDPGPRGRTAFRFRLPCTVRYDVYGEAASATLLDISAGGISVEKASHPLPTDSTAEMQLHFADGVDPIDVEVQVVRQTPRGFAGRFVNLRGQRAIRLWDHLTEALKAQIGEKPDPSGS